MDELYDMIHGNNMKSLISNSVTPKSPEQVKSISITETTSEMSDLISSSSKFGFVHDCQPFKNGYLYSTLVVGASLQCAEALKSEKAKIAINWDGGELEAIFWGKKNSKCAFDFPICRQTSCRTL